MILLSALNLSTSCLRRSAAACAGLLAAAAGLRAPAFGLGAPDPLRHARLSAFPGIFSGLDPTAHPALWEVTAEIVVIVVLFATGLRIDDLGGGGFGAPRWVCWRSPCLSPSGPWRRWVGR